MDTPDLRTENVDGGVLSEAASVPVTVEQPRVREQWERREGETAKAWNAFRIYRDMDPADRSVSKTKTKLGVGTTPHVDMWCSKFQWVSRAGAYDEHMDELKRNQRERERLAASDRRVQIAKNMQLVGGAAVQELGKKIQEALQAGEPIPKISLKDATAIINAGVQIERLESGESTQNVAIEGMILIDDVTKRERELIQIIMEAIRANTEPETARRISEYIETRCAAQHQ